MTLRLLALATLAPLALATSTASAQAPGQWAPPPPSDYAAPPPPPPIVEQRWSVGLSMQHTTVATDDGAAEANFAGGEIALRYRGWRHLELELSFGGGRQQLDDGSEGDLALGYGTLAARYRFNPHQSWNWWLLAGFGGTTIARYDASDDELADANRPHGTIGVGFEKRWSRLALQAELRAIGYGQTETEMELADYGMPMPNLSGGSFSLGASYYF